MNRKKAHKTPKVFKTPKSVLKSKIGIVTARFNSDITEKLREGAREFIEDQGGFEIFDVTVPGAVEIPLAAQALIEKKGCKGIVALGAVIQGETAHFDYVCDSVTQALTQLMMTTQVPIGFGVLTTKNLKQAQDRAGGKHGHKGVEAAEATLEMMGLLENL